MLKKTLKICLGFFAALALSSPLAASALNQSELPMSQHNFQGFVPDSNESNPLDQDPNLVRLMVHPSLTWVTDQLLDAYQARYPDSHFRIHQGTQNDLLDLLEDNYDFDILLDGEISRGMARVEDGWAVETRVLALGRLALWAPLETVRSLNVLSLRDDPIGLTPENYPYHRAAREVLERHELLEDYEHRLEAVRLGESLYDKVDGGELPAAFLPYHRVVEAGIQRRRAVMKIPVQFHGAITHSATLMRKGQGRPAVSQFWNFLFSEEAAQIFQEAGFD
ncbi:molybdate ABC transporter substrate-binding protein [Marinospirillum perlucidum]|uniref:molybdate ABC transporter substrate-binding protein n=1 Tax=Marinospirillum perlucidum TaxID=1982602 RepID=UPI000DF4661B|nr:substrate-binding domain-containing protein [Marinospirillum perlucidum]